MRAWVSATAIATVATISCATAACAVVGAVVELYTMDPSASKLKVIDTAIYVSPFQTSPEGDTSPKLATRKSKRGCPKIRRPSNNPLYKVAFPGLLHHPIRFMRPNRGTLKKLNRPRN